jgi:hypothetical protein
MSCAIIVVVAVALALIVGFRFGTGHINKQIKGIVDEYDDRSKGGKFDAKS